MERKRQKKLRQKEQKAKEQRYGEKEDDKESIDEVPESMPLAETSSPSVACDSQTPIPNMSHHVPLSNVEHWNTDEYVDPESQPGFGCGQSNSSTGPNVERKIVQVSGRRRQVVARWQALPNSQRSMLNSIHAGETFHASKHGAVQNRGTHRDLRIASTTNKVWSRKPKPEYNGENLKARVQTEVIKNHEVLIGSISVTLGDCSEEVNFLSGACDDCPTEYQMPKSNIQDKPNRPDSAQSGMNRSKVKLWRQVSRHGTKGPIPVQNDSRPSEWDATAEKGHSETLSSESCERLCAMDAYNGGMENVSMYLSETGNSGFSIQDAKTFLAQSKFIIILYVSSCTLHNSKNIEQLLLLHTELQTLAGWKEAIAADHVQLVLGSDLEPSDCTDIQTDSEEAVSQSSKIHKRSIVGNEENRLVNVDTIESLIPGPAKARFRTKPEKGVKIYIPKQKTTG